MANSHLLDLSSKKLELDEIFDSVINKIPDLCMPQAYRWAREDDFYERTKSLEHEPFRRQQYFDKYISLASQPAGQSELSGTPIAGTSKTILTRPEIKMELDKLEKSLTKQVRDKFELERIRKRKVRELLKKRYSRMSIGVKAISDRCANRVGFGKLFISMPEPNYPFANPMPSCMVTKDNVDNLREIIVAALEVEWEMLTPVRPDSEYEEKYFDKLINLHRLRHKARLESGYYETNRVVPFKHVRHNYLLNPKLSSIAPQVELKSASKSFFEANQEENLQTKDKSREVLLDVEIPKLTLSSDERTDELIEDNTSPNQHHRRPSRASPWIRDVSSQRIQGPDDERVENRVEAIVSQLMNTGLED